MEKRVFFTHKFLPYLLLAPQIVIIYIFFLWPASQALLQSFLQEDPFGLSTQFVWFQNFHYIFHDKFYVKSLYTTALFGVAVTGIAMVFALFLAVMADRVIRGATAYKTLIVWPYAVAPAVAAVLWMFMFNPTVGVIAFFLKAHGYAWNHVLNGGEAFLLVVIASAWKRISITFYSSWPDSVTVPKILIEAAAIDGAKPSSDFGISFRCSKFTSIFSTGDEYYLCFFETLESIKSPKAGQCATEILVHKVFRDGF